MDDWFAVWCLRSGNLAEEFATHAEYERALPEMRALWEPEFPFVVLHHTPDAIEIVYESPRDA